MKDLKNVFCLNDMAIVLSVQSELAIRNKQVSTGSCLMASPFLIVSLCSSLRKLHISNHQHSVIASFCTIAESLIASSDWTFEQNIEVVFKRIFITVEERALTLPPLTFLSPCRCENGPEMGEREERGERERKKEREMREKTVRSIRK